MSKVRPIDANALWELMRTYDDYQGAKEAHDVELIHRDSILFAIETAPTLDAVPVRHGYNKQIEFPSQFECSVCGWESWDTYCGDTDTFNYCPHCGAKMDSADGERRNDG